MLAAVAVRDQVARLIWQTRGVWGNRQHFRRAVHVLRLPLHGRVPFGVTTSGQFPSFVAGLGGFPVLAASEKKGVGARERFYFGVRRRARERDVADFHSAELRASYR